MRKPILNICLTFLMLLVLPLWSFKGPKSKNYMNPGRRQLTEASIIGCAPAPDPSTIHADPTGKFAPVFPGWGHYTYSIKTNNDSTQFFFDQGLSMYYSYHLTEALASFKEASRRDPACAMAYWGQALSMGPYYNSSYYKMPPAVLPVIKKMNDVANEATKAEKDLIEAMNNRYSADTADSRRKELNQAYSEHLEALINKYPADPDIKALYVDAVMLEHSWDFWETDGTPKTWTLQLITLCDQILKDRPTHPAALHYQIHLVEASLHPEKALQNAGLLVSTMPGVSHMVHMSSHMYQRNGLFEKGVAVNETASRLQLYYDSMAPNLNLGKFGLTHFYGVGSFCALNANMFTKGIQSSLKLREMFSAEYKPRLSNAFFQYLYMMPMFVCIRSGRWTEALSLPAPDSNLHLALLLDDFGKGLASLRLHDSISAHRYLDNLRILLKDSSLSKRVKPFNKPSESGRIAECILAGEIACYEGHFDDALRYHEEAVSTEDKMIYHEPKDWPIPARQYLGACLLKLKKTTKAEEVYRKDLALNPDNGWSLLGLYQSLVSQGKTKEAVDYRTRYMHAFADANELPPASVY